MKSFILGKPTEPLQSEHVTSIIVPLGEYSTRPESVAGKIIEDDRS